MKIFIDCFSKAFVWTATFAAYSVLLSRFMDAIHTPLYMQVPVAIVVGGVLITRTAHLWYYSAVCYRRDIYPNEDEEQ